jgi:mono/diheme cytochrome c family protein
MKNTDKILLYSFIILMCGIFFSCNSSSITKKTSPADTSYTLTATPTGKDQPGKVLYKKYCLTCHQANGSGVPGMFPPLGSGSWISKNPDELVPLILKGLKGEIEVNGESYKSAMPPQTKITDQELALVLTYVRSNFGNHFDSVTPDKVKKVREGLEEKK